MTTPTGVGRHPGYGQHGPKHYTRCALTRGDLKLASADMGWFTVEQITVKVRDKITPEAAVRQYVCHQYRGNRNPCSSESMLDVIRKGMWCIVNRRLMQATSHGVFERRKTSDGTMQFRLKESKKADTKDRRTANGRRHAATRRN